MGILKSTDTSSNNVFGPHFSTNELHMKLINFRIRLYKYLTSSQDIDSYVIYFYLRMF